LIALAAHMTYQIAEQALDLQPMPTVAKTV
jgi:hypothetical protein